MPWARREDAARSAGLPPRRRAAQLDRLVAALEADTTAAAAGPRLVDGRGRVELSWGPMIGPANELRQKVLGLMHERGFGPATRHVHRRAHQARAVDWVSGACLLVRRRAAEAVGLLDERYFMYAEDVDFCASLRAQGGRILFVPTAEIVHLRGRSRAAAAESTRRRYRESQLAFYAKHHPGWLPVLRLYLRIKGDLP